MSKTEQAIRDLLDIIKIQKGQMEDVLEIIKDLKRRIEILEKERNTVTSPNPFRNKY